MLYSQIAECLQTLSACQMEKKISIIFYIEECSIQEIGKTNFVKVCGTVTVLFLFPFSRLSLFNLTSLLCTFAPSNLQAH